MQRPVTLPPAPHGHNGLGRRSAVLPVENLGWVKLAASNRALINWAKHYGPTADPEQDARNGATILLRTHRGWRGRRHRRRLRHGLPLTVHVHDDCGRHWRCFRSVACSARRAKGSSFGAATAGTKGHSLPQGSSKQLFFQFSLLHLLSSCIHVIHKWAFKAHSCARSCDLEPHLLSCCHCGMSRRAMAAAACDRRAHR